MDIDEIFVRTGEMGSFQKKCFLVFCSVSVFCGTQMVQNIFDGAIPSDLKCKSDPLLKACDEACQGTTYLDSFKSFATEVNCK